jgi:phenylpyruvate tautomerase PptA (4-oxalocrotonate tautomerase family)
MATKTELLGRLEELIAQEDVEAAADAVEGTKEAYEALVANLQQQQHDGSNGAEGTAPPADGPRPIESAPLTDEDDKRFKQLLDAFNQRVNDIRRKKAKEESDNLAAKQGVMEELKALITGEENIGSAFVRFKELQERWKTIGPVPQHAYRDLQSDFSHLLDEFFYHIRIYKELRDHDLRKNTALKQALIADVTALSVKDNVKELETHVRDYQDKWQQIGPVVKEEWEAIRDAFWAATRVVYDKINEHYKARRAEHEANLAAKQALVEKVTTLVASVEANSAREWKTYTDQVIELQQAWKSVGFATRKDNERIWKEFRNACNGFFDAKKAWFDQLRDQYKGVRDKKMALLNEAIALKESTEWRKTADRLKALQQQWKEAGSAGPRDENKLWNKFREACDAFFQNRKATFAEQDAAQAVNQQGKETLLAEIEAFQHSGDRNKDIESLKAFSLRWMNSGRVSPKQFDEMNGRYRAALDKHYGQLKMEADERQKMRFQGHVEELKSGPDGKFNLERESRFLKRKIEEIESEKKQMEGNMGMFNFKSASGEEMKKDMEKKIEKLARDVERLKGQHRELLKELK